ncbi:2-oxoglutarate dehydrogenase E1 component [Cesiribacter andamanensis]|uniref:oxoglutarate dehydrogenase (succinyl-transferring) n=1 Tax=Cesiribacter andamanensis AMV16 TaxID=1279009 RepID=M7N5G3_9BACT|nr:2-oxoglutarate dehydrogenase E1 component [Cesiribacter andamanensis]EMR03858.1 2-oxoglutarate dehydrogenase E1 component [Cesiribacter andamanensis AMV16]
MDKFSYIANAHGHYLEELYQAYQADPQSVDPSWQKFFEGFDFAQQAFPMLPGGESTAERNGQQTAASPRAADTPAAAAPAISSGNAKELNVSQLIHAYRSRGHLKSKTNPVRERRNHKAYLDITDFGLTEADLDQEFDAGKEIGIGRAPLRKIVEALRYIYVGTVGFEFMYIRNPDMLEWFKNKAEEEALKFNPPLEEKKQILKKLNEAVVFENFLHTKYLGQKRFSLEGGESTIPALDAGITRAGELGVKEVVIGMAHRGRLNVLANIMGKTYEQIFNEFEGGYDVDLTMGDGDVKYHMGYSSQVDVGGNRVDLKLAPNPSHLEAVDPVVEGFARAKIDWQYNNDVNSTLPILIHGDAAVAGQGIVYELIQMSKLKAYATGGTIHFVINNQVGFTTDYDDARSSIYCTDVAKVVDAPVLHVNGDDPEAVVFCMKLAVEYRQKFNNDIFIDMVCYRRHGHNESDEPKFTQPQLYNIISKHANPREFYNKRLMERGDVDAQLAQRMDEEFRQLLQDRLDMVKQKPLPYQYQELEQAWQSLRRSKPEDFEQSPETGVAQEVLHKVAEALVKVPQGFRPIKQIEKALVQRKEMFFEQKEVNWAGAELLAYGSLLEEGNMVRLVGQDVERGTFSHRHAVLHDAKTGQAYNSLNHIREDNSEPFRVYNSLLSEYAAMGFEFGYAMANPHALVIWEAQFGDFANGAQVMIDQFVTPSESKWQRMNGLVLLLPHGYEGQGPEHSSARLERFLQLSAENNIIVANVTEPANFFHLLRRQLAWPFRKPLIVMSPKSLLRHPRVVSPMSELTEGRFREILPDSKVRGEGVKRVLLCSGKVYYDLLERQESEKRQDVAIIRLEQLHPFPQNALDAELENYPNAELFWVQEEPANMGAWNFILRVYPRPVRFIGRKASSSPATGYYKVHNKEQEELINRSFAIDQAPELPATDAGPVMQAEPRQAEPDHRNKSK